MAVDDKTNGKFDAYRERLKQIYCEIPLNGIYLNSRSVMNFSYEGPDGEIHNRGVDPMVSSVIVSSVVPGSAVLYKGGHGGGKTSMIEETSSRLFGVPREEIIEAMIRGNDDQNVNTLIASYNIGKLLANGEEEVRWRKFVTCPVKIIDEINRFPPTAQNALFEIINKGRVEFSDQVKKCTNYEVFATLNPNDVGTYPLSKPFLDRFGLCIPTPQIPAVEDLMALSSRKDDKVYSFKESKSPLTMKEAAEMEKLVADSVKISKDGLMYMIYAAQALATCERGDFGDKSHCELTLDERCKGCGYDTSESLCKSVEEGFSGRAFLETQRWAKGYSFFLNAFKDKANPEVQQSIIESLIPYVLYHRATPNNAIFTKDPFFGRTLNYLAEIASKAKKAYSVIQGPLNEIPEVLKGKVNPDNAKIHDVKKDLVVQQHFLPIVEAAKLPQFRAIYDEIDKATIIGDKELLELEQTLNFGVEMPQRAKAFLRSKAKLKTQGGEYI